MLSVDQECYYGIYNVECRSCSSISTHCYSILKEMMWKQNGGKFALLNLKSTTYSPLQVGTSITYMRFMYN